MIYQCPTPIAILLAVYNGEKYLKVQIDSIIEQTNHDWTLYIRDDASSDLTLEIIAGYISKYNNIVLLSDNLGNLGFNKNFSKLLESVEASYYMFCDADDYWLPEKVEVSYNVIREKELNNPGMPILVHTNFVDADENLVIDIKDQERKAKKYNPDNISDFKYIPICLTGGAVSMFNRIGKKYFFEENILSLNYDGWLGLQISRYGKLFYIPEILLIYRRHGNAVTIASSSHQNLRYILHKLKTPVKTFKHHWWFATQMELLGYGGKFKYFYYRILVFMKLLSARLISNK